VCIPGVFTDYVRGQFIEKGKAGRKERETWSWKVGRICTKEISRVYGS